MPRELFLSKVAYLPNKKEIAAEFSNAGERFTQGYSFFPSMLFSSPILGNSIKSVLNVYDSKKFILEKLQNNVFKVTASTFEDLQKIRTLLVSSLKISPLLIEPERQFLIQRNWGYFDSFHFESNEWVKSEQKSFPIFSSEMFTKPLNEFVQDLLQENPEIGKNLIEKIAHSNFLKIPFTEIDLSQKQLMETFFENVFFANNFAVNYSFEKQSNNSMRPNGKFSNLTEIDFSPVFSDLLTNSFYNISFDSINCGCCNPESPNSVNVLPSSFALVEMLSDGIYFESSNIDWSNSYHESRPFKEERLKRKNEWHLKFFPVGPFFRNQKQLIPLNDAVELVNEEKARIVSFELSWFCSKKEGFISKELKQLNREIVFLNKKLNGIEQFFGKQFNLLSSTELEKELEFNYLLALRNAFQNAYYLVPYYLGSNSSRFFSPVLASHIKCLQNATIKKFNQFVEEKGFRNIYNNSQKAFVRTDNALELVKQFSETESIPMPEIVKKHKVLGF